MMDFPDLFGAAMNALMARGFDFPRRARQMLAEVLGPGSSETMEFLMGPDAIKNPRLFALRGSRFFGNGCLIVCKLIAAAAIEEVGGSRDIEAVRDYELESARFLNVAQVVDGGRQALLHDARVPDEMQQYRESTICPSCGASVRGRGRCQHCGIRL